MGICYVVGAGDCQGVTVTPQENDYIIAADAGLTALRQWGITPHLAVGDFDSLSAVPADVSVLRFPVRKDETDTQLAVEEGLKRGYKHFALLGGTGGRTDHTLANLQLLTYLAARGCRGVLLGGGVAATVIADGASWRMQQETGTVSVFCFSDTATGVSIEGLDYTAADITLTKELPGGVSNAFVGQEATVHVERGALLIWWEWQVQENALKCLE